LASVLFLTACGGKSSPAGGKSSSPQAIQSVVAKLHCTGYERDATIAPGTASPFAIARSASPHHHAAVCPRETEHRDRARRLPRVPNWWIAARGLLVQKLADALVELADFADGLR
jgi:hypothetical protein